MGGYEQQQQNRQGPFTLRVKLVGASGLVACDINGKSDPYALVRFDGQPKPFSKKDGEKKLKGKDKSKKTKKHQTKVQKKTLSPQWNESFDLVIQTIPQAADIITVVIFDYDSVGEHDFMGSAHIEMNGLQQGVERTGTYKVYSKKGTVTVHVTAVNFSVFNDPNATSKIESNKLLGADNAKKRLEYQKQKKVQDSKKKAGKTVGKGLKSLGKMF
jgi:Ca2+-dependent lipid-binding protein